MGEDSHRSHPAPTTIMKLLKCEWQIKPKYASL